MHKRHLTALGVLLATAALGACNQPTEDDTVGGDVAGTGTPTAETTPATPTTPAPTAGNPGVPPRPTSVTGTTLMVASAGASEPYVADSAGSALYALEGNQDGSGCTDACQEAWPPLLVEDGQPTAGPQLQPDLVGTLQREDGAVQVTYNGHPLYRYAADTGTGRTAGHSVEDQWGHWYLIGPQGELLHDDAAQPAEASGAATMEPGTPAEDAGT